MEIDPSNKGKTIILTLKSGFQFEGKLLFMDNEIIVLGEQNQDLGQYWFVHHIGQEDVAAWTFFRTMEPPEPDYDGYPDICAPDGSVHVGKDGQRRCACNTQKMV